MYSDYYDYLDAKTQARLERRERELHKRKYGMRVSGRGNRLLAELSIKSKKDKSRRK